MSLFGGGRRLAALEQGFAAMQRRLDELTEALDEARRENGELRAALTGERERGERERLERVSLARRLDAEARDRETLAAALLQRIERARD